mmetsp:Transcript_4263/g.4041  ORF Transcript_4263/g.4041 Transcript_4263/m.4041 type:complete len:191 (-) Transcript_4263:341-913(-)
MQSRILSIFIIIALSALCSISAFSVSYTTVMSTTTAPPREKTRRKTTPKRGQREDDDRIRKYNDNPLEYMEDEFATRNPEDPFHILLLDATFEQNERITIQYVSNSVSYVCDMPEGDAFELTSMAASNGMSCLGTWKRETCLSLGRKLQNMDIVCRVVPYTDGGSRSWQAKGSDMGSGADEYIDVGSGFE